MRRRDFIRNLPIGTTSAFVVPCRFAARAEENDMKPNVLSLFADDYSHEALSLFGSEVGAGFQRPETLPGVP